MPSLDSQWLKLAAQIEWIERELPKHRPHSERRGELLRDLRKHRTARLAIGEKIKRRDQRKAVAA